MKSLSNPAALPKLPIWLASKAWQVLSTKNPNFNKTASCSHNCLLRHEDHHRGIGIPGYTLGSVEGYGRSNECSSSLTAAQRDVEFALIPSAVVVTTRFIYEFVDPTALGSVDETIRFFSSSFPHLLQAATFTFRRDGRRRQPTTDPFRLASRRCTGRCHLVAFSWRDVNQLVGVAVGRCRRSGEESRSTKSVLDRDAVNSLNVSVGVPYSLTGSELSKHETMIGYEPHRVVDEQTGKGERIIGDDNI